MSLTTTILNYDQSFRFNGYSLSGISDLSFSAEMGVSLVPSLGNKSFGFSKAGPSVGVVDFSRQLIYADPVLQCTGASACSGVFSYGSVEYGFSSGYLTEYSVSCGVGQVPSVSSSITVYGEMKTGASSHTGITHPDIFVPSQRSIILTNDYNSSNRVKSFDYSLSMVRDPRYSVGGGLFPSAVVSILPISVAASATFDVAGFSPLDLQNFVRGISAPNFIIQIKNRDLSQTLMTLPVSNAQILSQEIQGTVDSPLTLTLNYGGYLE